MVLDQTNNLGQPIGFSMCHWEERLPPGREPLSGVFCRLEPLSQSDHAKDLFDAFSLNLDNSNWTYLPNGPFAEFAEFDSWVEQASLSTDPLFHAIIDPGTGKAVGVASYLRIEPAVGVIEVGHIHYSPLMQKTPVATEAMFLMMKRVFDELGYRRYEWKCDALNQPSRVAAARLGFTYEGLFRQATVYKGRNRDTAWFSIIDTEWPNIKSAFEAWCSADNFDSAGKQIASLESLRQSKRPL